MTAQPETPTPLPEMIQLSLTKDEAHLYSQLAALGVAAALFQLYPAGSIPEAHARIAMDDATREVLPILVTNAGRDALHAVQERLFTLVAAAWPKENVERKLL